MLGTVSGRELDLSRLTDDEAQHVWQVVQRDFDLRKKEEDRLGELKTKIEQEDCKREMLGHWVNMTKSHCIRCLKAFKFLVNSRCQCLDCQLYICRSCSRYNKKERGWVCDPCHMARVLKIGTLEWYHENLRARFKHFGSAKVMRSLFKRVSGNSTYSSDDEDAKLQKHNTQSNPEIHTLGFEDSCMDAADSQRYNQSFCSNQMKKNKRRLTVDPIDFGLDCDYVTELRRHSHQTPDFADVMMMNGGVRESGMASVFHRFLKEQHKSLDVGSDPSFTSQQDDIAYLDNRAFPSRCMSRLSYSSCGSGSAWGPPGGGSSFILGADDVDSEEYDELRQAYPVYQGHLEPFDHISQESLNCPNHPQEITDLNRRMSAIESLLSHLQITVTSDPDTKSPQPQDSTSPLLSGEDVDIEEHQLRKKLIAMAGDISDHSLSSDEEDSKRSLFSQEILASEIATSRGDKKSTKVPSRPTSRTSVVVPRLDELTNSQKTDRSTQSVESKCHAQEDGSMSAFKGSTAVLFELEDKIAQAAADVRNTQTQVSYIENKIAALNPSGVPLEKRQKSGVPLRTRRFSQIFPTNIANERGHMRRRLSLV
ncbi:melanophilin [Syngnathoides biaculeatus]|uniref:melanophilin n=1 Tax=Syngnathoides biaculeatus TaxID=300417 RepID=UPI002ADE7E78|nr:melanophilin [Syngnathoides biaculeatus]